jgi:hypothetical protein
MTFIQIQDMRDGTGSQNVGHDFEGERTDVCFAPKSGVRADIPGARALGPKGDIDEPPLLGSVIRDKRHASSAMSGKASALETMGVDLCENWQLF